MQNIDRFLTEKSVEFTVMGQERPFKALLNVPNLESLAKTSGGDWGPKFDFQLSPQKPVKICYVDLETGGEDSGRLDLSVLELRSPMLASERKSWPLYMVIPDHKKELSYNVYLDPNGDPVRAVVKTFADKFVCEEMLTK